MEQTMHWTRGGWRPEEIDMLWQEIRAASESGAPLRGVFEKMGATLGRKPNSVRNYYYMQLRDQAGEQLKRAAPFETFSEEDVHQLLRSVLMARGQGQSVRACVLALSGGDHSLMLRYQNKYRAILRKKPHLIAQVCQELQAEGLPCPDAETETKKEATAQLGEQSPLSGLEDQEVKAVLAALERLVQRANAPRSDRLRVQRDLLLMQLEDLQLAARSTIALCKDFLGAAEHQRMAGLEGFSQQLAEKVAQLESLSQ